jgi:Peptidogalycan biosysnthesis/recognition
MIVLETIGSAYADASINVGIDPAGLTAPSVPEFQRGTVNIASRKEIALLPHWQTAFASERKDHRFYELLEDTLKGEFDYGYFVVRNGKDICAIQPYFVCDQDLVAGINRHATKFFGRIRKLWPRFMRARTLMVGCAAGEGHLDGNELSQDAIAELLSHSLHRLARDLNCAMIVLKEFPSKYRASLRCFRRAGFTRVPSMPMTMMNIDYKDFEDYARKKLSPGTREQIRRKLRVAGRAQPAITMSVVDNVSAVVDEVYPLYLSVFERSALQFEKLTKEFLCEIGTRIPDKVRFIIWCQDKRTIAFALCMVQGDDIYHEYVGFDYSVAFKLHLYYRVFRDIVEWAITNGYKRFHSGSLNYDPKWHLRQSLDPLDLHVRHTSAAINTMLKWLLPLLEPTRSERILPNFHNYRELWE